MIDYNNISFKQRAFLVSQGIFQVLLTVFVTSTFWLNAYNGDWNKLHTWHVFLCTLGFSFLMAEAISLLNPGNAFSLGCNKLARGFLHGTLMVLAAIMIIAGVSIKIQDKNNNNRSHFASVHGIIGFTAYLLTIITFIGGFIVAFRKFLYKRFGIKPVLIKNCHIFLGIAAYILGTVSLCYGLRNYLSEASHATTTTFITILIFSVILNLVGPLTTLFRI